MLTKYFKFKTGTNSFKIDSENILQELCNKEIIIFTNAEEFAYLNKIYHYDSKFNINGIVLTNGKMFRDKKLKKKVIEKSQISEVKFDKILVLDSNFEEIINNIKYHILPDTDLVVTPFIEYVKEEKHNLEYLLKYNFEKKLIKLSNKMKNKKIVFYGAGIFFQLIQKYFDLSSFNVIGITDKRYSDTSSDNILYGYKVCKADNIINIMPDYVIITTKNYVHIWEGLYFNYLEHTKIKILPILKKNAFSLLHDIIKS